MSLLLSKIFVLKSLYIFVLLLIVIKVQGQSNLVNTNNQKLIWSDEFNMDGAPDTTKWAYDFGTGDWGWGNNEAQYYSN